MKPFGAICGTSRGRYSKPIKLSEAKLRWVSMENYRKLKTPTKARCESYQHIGKQLWFPYKEMYVQFWKLTPGELAAALIECDVFSLEMPPRIVCPDCIKKTTKGPHE